MAGDTRIPCNRDVSSRPVRHIVAVNSKHPYVRQRLCLRPKCVQLGGIEAGDRRTVVVAPEPETTGTYRKIRTRLSGFAIRQRLHEDGVDNAEDCSGCADSQSEREDHDHAETGIPPEAA